jgi:hypothetical protein
MQSERRERRSPLGLGPLEAAIMHVLWDAGSWLTIRDVRDRIDYAPVAYTTVASVTGILHDKALLVRSPEDPDGSPGRSAWWHRPACLVPEEDAEARFHVVEAQTTTAATTPEDSHTARADPGPPPDLVSVLPATTRSTTPLVTGFPTVVRPIWHALGTSASV